MPGPPTGGHTRSRTTFIALAVLATPLVAAGIAAAVSSSGPSAPMVAVSVPPGYRAVTDVYYGYAVPSTWTEDDDATTATGTYFYQGPTGWAGETVTTLRTAPPEAETGPAALGIFGTPEAEGWRLVGAAPATVPGATTAWRYEMVRGGATVAEVYDVWTAGSSTQLWIAVHADRATTATVLSTLRA